MFLIGTAVVSFRAKRHVSSPLTEKMFAVDIAREYRAQPENPLILRPGVKQAGIGD